MPQRSGRKKKRTQRSSKNELFGNLNILRYESFDTLKISDEDPNYYVETDQNFIQDVQNIAKVKRNMVLNILQVRKQTLSNQDCDEIDYKARIHREANIVNTNTKQKFEHIDKSDQCQCGCRRGRGDSISFCTDEQTLNALGPGVLLMFLFKRAIFVVLLMIILVYGIYALVTNLIGNKAQIDAECAKSEYCKYKKQASDENKDNNNVLYVVQFWLGFTFSIIWIITLRFIKFIGKEKNNLVDKKLKSASDYAIKIENLPTGNYSEKELIDFFDGLWLEVEKIEKKKITKSVIEVEPAKSPADVETNLFNMRAIQIIYNMQFSREMIEEVLLQSYNVDSLLVKIPGHKQRYKVEDIEEYRRQKTRLTDNYELLLDIRKRFLNDAEFRKKISSSCCIIELNNQKKRKEILKHFGKEKVSMLNKLQMRIKKLFGWGGKDLIFKGKVLSIERAPEPSDILWINCEKQFKLRRIFLIFFATFLIVVGSFAMIVGLQFLQNYVKRNATKFQEGALTGINIAMSASLLIVNKILWFSLFYLLEIEYNHTLTQKIISQMNKVLLASSINVIVLPIISNYIINNRNLYGNDGLSGMVFDYHIGVISGLAVKLFDPLFIVKKVAIQLRMTRNMIIRFFCASRNDVVPEKGVKEVNTFYEGEYFDVAENYVYIIGAIIHASFFAHLQPFIIILVAIMVLIFYLISRFKLLYMCKIPEMTELLVFETALAQAGLVPIMYGTGSLVISFMEDQISPNKIQMPWISSLIAIGIGLIGIFNPGDFLNKLVKKIMKSCKCLVIIPGEHQGESDEDSDESEMNEMTMMEDLNHEHNKGIEEDLMAVQNKNKTSRIEVYYENSNSLKLLGFELIFQGKEEKLIMDELKRFCEDFFPQNLRKGKTIGVDLVENLFKIRSRQASRNLPAIEFGQKTGRKSRKSGKEAKEGKDGKDQGLFANLFMGKKESARQSPTQRAQADKEEQMRLEREASELKKEDSINEQDSQTSLTHKIESG